MRAATCADPGQPLSAPREGVLQAAWHIPDYRLDLTLECGQTFRWHRFGPGWLGVIEGRRIELVQTGTLLTARAWGRAQDLARLENYLQLRTSLEAICATFPDDPHLHEAIRRWHGLRLLRQPAWECLASFLLSSAKQIVQICQVIERLCRRWGRPVPGPATGPRLWSFPSPERLAAASESELRACGAGFRAPFLLAAARAVAEGKLPLDDLPRRPYEEAREQLLALAGVGPKIADCVCLFGLGFLEAFPVDTWVKRVMQERYFGGRPVSEEVVARFGRRHFGRYAGYAQQYLFHDRRVAGRFSRPHRPAGAAM